MPEETPAIGKGKPEKDRSTEENILHEAEGGPTLPEGEAKPKPGQTSARGMQSGAEDDLTKPGHQTEDR
jgi:hypothetical protein